MQSYLNFLSSATFYITFSPKCKFCLPFCLFPPAAVRAICERLKTSREPHPPLGEGWGGAPRFFLTRISRISQNTIRHNLITRMLRRGN